MCTMRTFVPYVVSIWCRVSRTLEQKGHWKSVNSTSVTSAVAGPRTGAPSIGTL